MVIVRARGQSFWKIVGSSLLAGKWHRRQTRGQSRQLYRFTTCNGGNSDWACIIYLVVQAVAGFKFFWIGTVWCMVCPRLGVGSWETLGFSCRPADILKFMFYLVGGLSHPCSEKIRRCSEQTPIRDTGSLRNNKFVNISIPNSFESLRFICQLLLRKRPPFHGLASHNGLISDM